MRGILPVIILLAAAATADAQVPGGNVFLGYSNSGGDVGVSNHQDFNGWEASAEGKFLPFLGVAADLSGHFGSGTEVVGTCPLPCVSRKIDTSRYTFLLGPRVSISAGKFTPFAHVLVGVAHVTNSGFNSDTSFATGIGGGVDYKLIKGLAWRVQGDELHTRFFGGTQDHFRFSTGIVVRF